MRAGIGDTDRLHPLTDLTAECGGALVAIGDPRQLPAIGAGGMFERLAQQLPTAELQAHVSPSQRDALAQLAQRAREPEATTAARLLRAALIDHGGSRGAAAPPHHATRTRYPPPEDSNSP